MRADRLRRVRVAVATDEGAVFAVAVSDGSIGVSLGTVGGHELIRLTSIRRSRTRTHTIDKFAPSRFRAPSLRSVGPPVR